MSYAIALWGGVLLAGYFSVIQLLLVELLSLLIFWRHKRTFFIVLLAALVGISIYGLREMTQSRSIVARSIGSDVVITARVISDSHLSKSRVIGSRLLVGRTSFLASVETLESKSEKFRVRVPIRVLSSRAAVNNGEMLRLSGRLVASPERRIAALLIINQTPQSFSPPKRILREVDSLRNRFIELARQKGSDGSTLIPGMVIGDTRLESEDLLNSMRQSGLTHLTAVSGANFAIVVTFVLWATSWFVRRKSLRASVAIVFIAFFVIVVRPSPSVLRAAVMALVIIIAKVSGARALSSNSLALAIAAVVIADPFQAFDPGFILSVLATGGLVFLAPILRERMEKYLFPPIAELLSVTISATLVCAPYLLFLSGSISLGTIFFNCAVAAVIAPITILGFLSLVALPASLPLSEFLFSLAEPMATWIVTVARLHSGTRSIYISPVLYLFSLAIVLIAYKRYRLMLIVVMALIATISIIGYLNFPGSTWVVGQCDVGQGDALLINLGSSSAILIDAGPDPQLLQQCLREFRVRELPLVVLTHNHADHFQGITGNISARIGEVWISHEGNVLPKSHGLIRVVRENERAIIKGVTLDVLWPQSGDEQFSSIAGDGSAENNRSIVIRASTHGCTIMATGDIEPEAQERILARNKIDRACILKVAHHGSRYQSRQFLEQARPAIALISVGKGNSYGHPSRDTINELSRIGAKVYRTDNDGALAISWKNSESRRKYVFSVRTIGRKWWQVRWL